MTNREYDAFLSSVPKCEPLNDETLLRLAERIVEGTYRYTQDRDHTHAEILENVVSGLLSYACYYEPTVTEA